MFNKHGIVCENKQPVLYLFAQPFEVNTTAVKGIFEHLHEDVLLDWVYDYLEIYDVSFRGNLIKIVSETTIIRELEIPFYMRNLVPIAAGKIVNLEDVRRDGEKHVL